jgi:hypothetical protein
MKTGKANGCVLIAKNDKWKKYSDRALKTIKHYKLVAKMVLSRKTLNFSILSSKYDFSSRGLSYHLLSIILFLRFSCYKFMYYGMKTDKANGCVLIAKNDKWKKYSDRALKTIKHYVIFLTFIWHLTINTSFII